MKLTYKGLYWRTLSSILKLSFLWPVSLVYRFSTPQNVTCPPVKSCSTTYTFHCLPRFYYFVVWCTKEIFLQKVRFFMKLLLLLSPYLDNRVQKVPHEETFCQNFIRVRYCLKSPGSRNTLDVRWADWICRCYGWSHTLQDSLRRLSCVQINSPRFKQTTVLGKDPLWIPVGMLTTRFLTWNPIPELHLYLNVFVPFCFVLFYRR